MKKNMQFISLFICLITVMCGCSGDDIIKDEGPQKGSGGDGNIIKTRTYYVSASMGSDTYTAEQAKKTTTPWKTIQKAANTILGGDTVIVLSGIYHERVTVTARCNGTEEAPTVFMGNVDQSVVIDDRNDGVSNRWTSVFKIDGAQYIKVKGIKVQNAGWYGFSVENRSQNITIDNCFTYNTRASGIYSAYASNLTIINNNVRKACQERERLPNGDGSQECITVTRTNQFLISHNEVLDSTVDGNAGGEGIDAKGVSYDGEISFNYVHDIVPLGVYVDAGSGESYNIKVFSNKLVNTGGVAVAGELGGHARDIYFYNNIIINSLLSGFVFQNIQNGKFTNIYIVNNTFYNSNQTGGFGGDIANYSKNTENRNLVIRNNIFYNKLGKYRFSIWHDMAAPHVISNNLFYDFKASNAGGENSYNDDKLTAADIKNQNPMFVDESTYDLKIQSTSPAINMAIPITLPNSTMLMFDTDFSGKKRGTSKWDMGAFEH